MSTLICGSIAYDTIMVFHDRFKNHILPERLHILNVAFLAPEMRREFGGCAGNIAYNLQLLGGDPLIMATVGDDADPYLARLDALGLARTHVRRVPGSFTAQAFITTDLDDNQITAFHPGAMSFSHENAVADTQGVTLGIVAPDGRDGMQKHARDFAAAGIPFLFDPGQGLPMFSGDDLMEFLRLADYACFNDYEAQLLCDRTGRTLDQLAGEVSALIVTRGGEGSEIRVDGQCLQIPCVKAEAVVDPTGCGDAYRSGLLYGITAGWDWQKSGRLASLMGSIKIAQRGGQNHRPSRAEIGERYAAAFGETLC
ncbi:carbohydrate kinase family protein [Rhodocyclus tenuis]|uniref:carbohydrate kinase family protein n=1 Tax=Rhodocyclus tenuis TaxID=1066 RepID=UPI001903F441|nr:carbohydrate kinase family protein [Rhodocyclus tenuis]MBK1681841.1 carbohydrate kinase family protein [Rhodocyclus tenuis]